jgi:hypothetical protein
MCLSEGIVRQFLQKPLQKFSGLLRYIDNTYLYIGGYYKTNIIITLSNVAYSRHDLAENCSFGAKQHSFTIFHKNECSWFCHKDLYNVSALKQKSASRGIAILKHIMPVLALTPYC